MLREMIMSGFGGQGALLIGQVLAIAGTVENLNAIWRPTYGPEKRGGTAYCDVILSDEIIGSPIVDEPEIVIAMDERSFRQFEPAIVPGGLMLYNSSLCTSAPGREDIRYLPVPAGELAHQMGADKAANMVLLGALLAAEPLVSDQAVEAGLREKLGGSKAKLIASNLKAIELGRTCAAKPAQ